MWVELGMKVVERMGVAEVVVVVGEIVVQGWGVVVLESWGEREVEGGCFGSTPLAPQGLGCLLALRFWTSNKTFTAHPQPPRLAPFSSRATPIEGYNSNAPMGPPRLAASQSPFYGQTSNGGSVSMLVLAL